MLLLARGRLIAAGPPREVLGGGWYFATETARVTGGRAVIPEAGAELLRRATATRGRRVSWQAGVFAMLALVLIGGFAWFERSRPSARIVAAVAALAALGVAGRLVLAPIPNVVATTDVALLAGYTLGGGPGFAVGALSGLVSNFWLGQGPWTPWQMAGWGMVGVGGAMLAGLSGRRLGRWGLAGAGAIAGLAYGALLDLSVMVSYGGEQSLDRYLALSARGIPFNIAHAAGNAALMLAAGPAMVRMLDRYRERFEVRWSDAAARARRRGHRRRALRRPAAALASRRVGEERQDGRARLAGRRPERRRRLRDLHRRRLERRDDRLGDARARGGGPEPGGRDRGGKTPVQYLRSNRASITSTADLERTILALEGAGVDSRNFSGRDLVGELRDRQAKDGSFEHQVNLTAFAILAQRSARVPGSNFGKPAAWLRGIQNQNGGWGSLADAESEPDSTGAVLQALAVSPGGSNEVQRGGRWLGRSQHSDGGWSLTRGAAANSQSTAWAIQGLVAAGRDPANVDTKGQHRLRLPRCPSSRRRPLRLLVRERPDAGLGHRARAHRRRPGTVPDQGRQAQARQAGEWEGRWRRDADR